MLFFLVITSGLVFSSVPKAQGAPETRLVRPAYIQKWLQLMLAHSPDLQIKAKLAEQKSMAQWSAGGAWFPRLDLQLIQSRTNANILTGVLGPESDYRQSALGLSFPIYRRSVQLGVGLARAEAELAADDYQGALLEADWKLRQWVGQVLLAQYRLAALTKSLEAAQRTARGTQIQFQRGSRSQLDVLRTQAQVTILESQILGSQNEVRIALDNLLQSAGLSLTDLKDVGFPLESVDEKDLQGRLGLLTNSVRSGKSPIEGLTREAVVQEYLTRGRVKKAIETSLEINRFKAKLVMAKEWPELTFKASYQKIATDWDQLRDSPESRNLGLTLTIPLFNFGVGYSTYRESSALESVARIQGDQNLKAGLFKVEQLYEQILALQKLVQAQELRQKQSLELERLTQKSYEFGKSTVQDLLSAQNETLNAKIDVAKTRLDLVIAERQLEWNLGSFE